MRFGRVVGGLRRLEVACGVRIAKEVSIDDRGFEFVPSVFFKMLAVLLTVVLLGWVGAIRLHGFLARRDIVGSLICASGFAYVVTCGLCTQGNGNRATGKTNRACSRVV